MKPTTVLAAIALIVATTRPAAVEELCLTKSELLDVARMGSVMGIGGALNRCGACLGERNRPTIDKYEASGMLVDFRRAEAAVQSSRVKFGYADELVRDAARKYAADLSADCKACEKTADVIDALSSAGARSELYQAEAEKIGMTPAFKSCP